MAEAQRSKSGSTPARSLRSQDPKLKSFYDRNLRFRRARPSRRIKAPGAHDDSASPHPRKRRAGRKQCKLELNSIFNFIMTTPTPFIVAIVFLNQPGREPSSSPSARLEACEQTLTPLLGPDVSLVGRRHLSPDVGEYIFSSPSTIPDAESLSQLLRDPGVAALERQQDAQVVFQRPSVHRTHKRLAVFDMDSTLIQQEVVDEMARSLGPRFQREVAAITARAMDGELDFEESLRARCRLLAGVRSGIWEELKGVVTLTPGAKDLVVCLRRLGVRTAVLSGGFAPLATWLKDEVLGLDYAFANHLVVSADGRELTGELEGQIVHAEQKRRLVREIAAKEGVLLEQVVCVGDGANDLPMMGVAGLGLAFNAKPKVQEMAPARLNRKSLMDVMYLLGFSEGEQLELLA